MYHAELRVVSAPQRNPAEALRALAAMLVLLHNVAENAAPQEEAAGPSLTGHDTARRIGALADGYHRAGSVAQRRLDALAQETQRIANLGLGLMMQLDHQPGAASSAAAAMLADTIDQAVRRMEAMLPSAPGQSVQAAS